VKGKVSLSKRIVSGDRPTGPLHLGHLVGSLEKRRELQEEYECFFLIADYQVLTDHLKDFKEVPQNVWEVLLDWLSVGLSPEKATFFLQSGVPQLAELTLYFSFLVSLARLKRNPTIKEEAKNVGINAEGDHISYGFLGYPISQAADILAFKANYVPVGEDQKPHIEQTREIARNFNRLFKEIFPLPEALLSSTTRLVGLDGAQKMGKSTANAIFLSDTPEEVRRKIKSAVTDRAKIYKNDPGDPSVCSIYSYYKALIKTSLSEIAQACRQGHRGCVACKEELAKGVNQLLAPMREKRAFFTSRKKELSEILYQGTVRARAEAEKTLREVREAIFDYRKTFSFTLHT
jgi:tryptophanyl-tRNA synthetase